MPLRALLGPVVSILVVAGLATGLLMQGSRHVLRDNEPREFSRQMQDWMRRLRGRPLQGSAAAARLKALKQRNDLAAKLNSHSNGGPQVDGGANWVSIGPQPANDPSYGQAGGRTTAIAVDPTNDNTVFVGTSGGGVWRSSDGGQTWRPLTDSQSSLAIGSLAIDPTNHLIIYAGTGEKEDFGQDAYYGAGILKSTDGGNTWTLISGGGMTGVSIGSIAVNPTQPNNLLATQFGGGGTGIVSSPDGGVTWTQSLAVQSGQFATSVVFDNVGNAYAGVGSFQQASGSTNAIMKLPAGGAQWSAVTASGNGLDFALAGRYEITLAPSNPNFVYVVIANNLADTAGGYDLLALLVSKDGFGSYVYYPFPLGDNGSALNSCAPQCYYNLALAVDPANPSHLFAGGSSIGYQANGYFGASQLISIEFNPDPYTGYSSLTSLSPGSDGVVPHPDFHGLAITADGQKFYAANDGGVWQLNNFNSSNFTWTSLSATLDTIEFYELSLDATNLQNGFGGAQDNGVLHYQGSPSWQEVYCGDGAYTAIDPTTPSNVYAACAQALFAGVAAIAKSTDGGNTFANAATGINSTDTPNFIAPLVMDPSNSTILYFGTNHIYQSINGAGSWQQISSCDFGDPTCQSPSTGDTVYSIAVAPQDSKTIWVGTARGLLWVTHDGTSSSPTFSAVSIPNSLNSLTGYSNAVTGIAIDPNNVNDVFISLSGFNGSRVLNTQDGTSFVDSTGGLPGIPVNGIVFDPDAAGTLYVATDVGAYYTTNAGAAWLPLGIGLPNVALRAIAFHRSSRTLRAATNGRGMWQLAVGGGAADFLLSGAALSPSSFTAGGSATSTITVNSANGFNSNVALTCSVTPIASEGPTCSLNPSSVSPSTSPVTSTLTVNTTAASTLFVMPNGPGRWASWYATMLLVPVFILCTRRPLSRNPRNVATLMAIVLALFGPSLLLISCGNSSGSTGGTSNLGTPAGQYTITVTGTAGSLTHQQALTLTVQ